MGKRGPAPKPETEKYVMKSFRFPPGLWEAVERHVPKGERSRLIQTCLERAVAPGAAPPPAEQPAPGELSSPEPLPAPHPAGPALLTREALRDLQDRLGRELDTSRAPVNPALHKRVTAVALGSLRFLEQMLAAAEAQEADRLLPERLETREAYTRAERHFRALIARCAEIQEQDEGRPVGPSGRQ
jgi:hypothetical protein